jgi:hypothetical protein
MACASQMLYAPQRTNPPSLFPDFARSFSADGYGLIRAFTSNKNEIKSGQRPAGKRGPGSFALWVEGFFRLEVFTSVCFFIGVHEVAALSFGYFWIKPKVTAFPAANERDDDLILDHINLRSNPNAVS